MVLPLISHLLTEKLRFSPLRRDVSISRASIVALVVGSVGIAIAKQAQSTKVVAAIYVYALGCGYSPAMYSLLGLLSGGHHIGLLYAIIGAMQSIGTFLAGLMLGATAEIVPFIFTVMFLAGVVGALFYLKLEDTEEGEPIWIDMDYLESPSS
jgi:MFS family permease